MSDEQIKQRIAYLVQHGGLYDDPIADVRRTARLALGVSAVVLVLSVVELVFAMA
jgi:hypothetical protein